MFRLMKNVKKQDWLLFFVSCFVIYGVVWLDLKLPDYMSGITTLIQTQGSEMSEVLSAGGKMLLCAFGSMVLSALVSLITARIASNFSAALRERMFRKVSDFSQAEINRFSTASLITRTTNDVNQVQMLIIFGMQSVVRAPIMAVTAIVKISGKSKEWMITTAAAIVLMLLIIVIVVFLSLPKFKRVQSLTDDVNRLTRENLGGLKVIRAYNAEKYQMNKFEQVNDDLMKNQLFTGRAMGFLMPSISLAMSGLALAIYWVGAYLLNKANLLNKLSVFSDMVVFSSYAMQVVMAFMLLIMIFMIYPRASVSARRINEVLGTRTSLVPGTAISGISGHEGEVVFDHVSFRYPDSDGGNVISDISFYAHKGETVALIGATGCGKSTVINLIPRFYDATEGHVLVDGRDVKDYSPEALHNKIGYISQTAFMFGTDIRTNIAYGDNGNGPLSDEAVQSAAKTAEAAEFIENKENGYDSIVAQNGTNLSGGQRQRLSIARAVARGAEILIFDDSFSALDYRTDRKLRSNLAKECADTTRIIVAQRIGTIRDADRIIVLEDGKIAGIGKHEELLDSCETYRQIALSQLSKEELNG